MVGTHGHSRLRLSISISPMDAVSSWIEATHSLFNFRRTRLGGYHLLPTAQPNGDNRELWTLAEGTGTSSTVKNTKSTSQRCFLWTKLTCAKFYLPRISLTMPPNHYPTEIQTHPVKLQRNHKILHDNVNSENFAKYQAQSAQTTSDHNTNLLYATDEEGFLRGRIPRRTTYAHRRITSSKPPNSIQIRKITADFRKDICSSDKNVIAHPCPIPSKISTPRTRLHSLGSIKPQHNSINDILTEKVVAPRT